jgi:hypothetical protein
MEAKMALDATTAFLAGEISQAREALISKARTAPPGHCWPAWELKMRARNGWSDGAMNLALNRLIADGTFTVAGDSVRLNH